ncbi:MAG: hypothetical protein QOF99_1246 [Pseudonocardiales bacterium]|nr:hypothetical protein [Pseudonocardiales bacterium]
MKVTGYSYPWDVLESPGFVDRAARLGLDEVAVAVSYHSTRAATPWASERTAVLARHAALYRPVREHAWAGARLRPAVPDWVAAEDSASAAVHELTAAGLPTAAWLVLTHNSALGRANPDVTVHNCFGESYPWALCPSRPEVRDFTATLTAEALAGLPVSTVVLEACGQLGAVHQCEHEKTDAVWGPAAARLLSVCCCPACGARWAAAGADPVEVRGRLRAEVRALIDGGDLTATGDGLPADLGQLLLGTRQLATDALREGVLAGVRTALGGAARVVLHAAVDPWTTGALPGLTPTAAGGVDAVVLQCWQPGAASLGAVATAHTELPTGTDLGAYVTAVGANPVPDLAGYVTELGRAGANELHLYHLGLAGPARQPDLTAAVAAARELRPGRTRTATAHGS